MILARLFGELFVFERSLRLLEHHEADLDDAGLESLLARVNMAAERLQGSGRPGLVSTPRDYAALVDLFATNHDPGRIDELSPMLDRLKLKPNLKMAIRRAATRLLDDERNPSVTNNNFYAPVSGIIIGDHASNNRFNSQVNLPNLQDDLARMVEFARAEGATETQIAAIEEAKQAAAAGDVEKAKSALQKLGEWGGKFATTVGATVAGALIKAQLGL